MRIAQAGCHGSKSQIQVSRTETSRSRPKQAIKTKIAGERLPEVHGLRDDELARDVIMLGDCIDVLKRLPAESVDLVFADPPYNLQLERALSRPDQSLVDAVDDDWDKFASFADYDRFTRDWLTAARRVMKTRRDPLRDRLLPQHLSCRRHASRTSASGSSTTSSGCKSNPMPNFRGRRFTNAHETLIWASQEPAIAKRLHLQLRGAEGRQRGQPDAVRLASFRSAPGAERLKNERWP